MLNCWACKYALHSAAAGVGTFSCCLASFEFQPFNRIVLSLVPTHLIRQIVSVDNFRVSTFKMKNAKNFMRNSKFYIYYSNYSSYVICIVSC